MDISYAQKLAWENKLMKNFNTRDVALEFGLLTAEVGEAFTAWRKGLPDLGEELADVFLYLTAVAEMNIKARSSPSVRTARRATPSPAAVTATRA
ncbi:hypothetical protein [Streptomyces kronopolitis]